jgi:signal transduction histidine kinase
MISLSNLLVSGRANFEPYGISPIGLSFKRPEREVEYQTFFVRIMTTHVRFAVVMGMFIIVFYAILDPYIYEERESLNFARLIRFLLLLPSALMVFLATFHPLFRACAWLTNTTGIGLVGIGCCLLAYRSNSLILVYTFPALVMATAYSFFLLALLFPNAFLVGAFINASYSFVIWTVDIPLGMGIGVNVSMVTILLLFAMAAYQKELISRQLFASELREREALTRQAQKDNRYLAWLRQLAEFLRHEVRQPIAQISSSIEIVQLTCRQDDKLKAYLTSAALGTQHVWNLVERASQATDAEAFVRQCQLHSTDLWSLLAEQVEAYRRSNSGIAFDLQCPTAVRVHADPTLIKEAVGNLLGNAASFADEASAVKVVLEIDGARVAIKVSNKGPPIEGDTERLFGPFASTRAGPSSEHQGFGLYLVRLIAEEHGGVAAIRNLSDRSGVEATILLPLGS